MSGEDEREQPSASSDMCSLTLVEELGAAAPTPASAPHWMTRMMPLEVDGSSPPELGHQLVYTNVAKALFGEGRSLEIGKYLVEARIGEGGMGEVYLCRDLELGRAVAVKRVLGQGSARAHERLRREAQALATLNHPNVVTVYDSGVHEGHFFVVMEFVEGETLREWCARPRPWREVLDTLIAAGRGLAAAHAAGIIHRDFKPDNVLISHAGAVRVADFGLALREADAKDSGGQLPEGERGCARAGRLSADGAVLGTRAYMPIEQLRGEEVDARSDQFAFCVTLYEALWGECPYPMHRRIERAQQLRAAPVRPHDHLAIYRVLRRGLDPDPAQRWPGMDPLLDALAQIPRRRRILAGTAVVAPLLALCAALAVHQLRDTARTEQLAGCGAVDVEFEGIWDEHTQAQLEAHGAALGRPHSAESVARLRTRIDAWADAWLSERRAVCAVAGGTPTRRERARQRCLERQRQRVATITAGVLKGDADTLAYALVAVEQIGDPRSCAEDPRGLELDPPPASRETRVTQLRDELAGAAQQRLLGEPGAALERLAALEARVEALDYGPVQAEYSAELGRAHEELHTPELAAQAYERGLELAVRHRHDQLAAELALQRAELDLFEFDDLHAAQLRYEQADRYVSRLPASAELRAALAFGQGRLAFAVAALDEGRRETQRSLELAGPRSPRRTQYLTGLAEILDAQGEAGAALELRRAAYQSAVELWGPEHPRTARPMANYGLALGEQDPEGLALRSQAANIARALASPRERAWGELQAAAVALHRGHVADARSLLERPSVAPSYARGRALALLASAEAMAGELDAAIVHAHQAREQYDAVRSLVEGGLARRDALETRAWLANLLVERGGAGDHARARTELDELVARAPERSSQAALAHLSLAELELLAQQLDEAELELRACARTGVQLERDDALAYALLRALVDLRRRSEEAPASVERFRELLRQTPQLRADFEPWLELSADERRRLEL